MKNAIVLFIAALFLTASVKAQSTADSIHAKYQMQPMPEALTIEKTFPVLGTYQLNTTNGTEQNVSITLDSTNRGIVWVSGFPEGTFKAYLKKSPGIYRIVSQKSESGKQIPEGTLFFDPSTNTLNVALGKTYDEADPTAVFGNLNTAGTDVTADNGNEVKVKTKTATSKTKTKNRLVFYTASKAETSSSTSTNAAKQ
jgi:hypothetical protein